MARKKIQTPEELLQDVAAEEDIDPELGFQFDKPPRSAPAGQMWLYNRYHKAFGVIFNSNEETWGPHCYRLVPNDLGKFCERKGVLKLDPKGVKNVYALVSKVDKAYGEPLDSSYDPGAEILMRDGVTVPKDVELLPIPD